MLKEVEIMYQHAIYICIFIEKFADLVEKF